MQLGMAGTICATLPAGLSSPGQTYLAPSGFAVAGTVSAVLSQAAVLLLGGAGICSGAFISDVHILFS